MNNEDDKIVIHIDETDFKVAFSSEEKFKAFWDDLIYKCVRAAEEVSDNGMD